MTSNRHLVLFGQSSFHMQSTHTTSQGSKSHIRLQTQKDQWTIPQECSPAVVPCSPAVVHLYKNGISQTVLKTLGD
jgi:hypothetical protein